MSKSKSKPEAVVEPIEAPEVEPEVETDETPKLTAKQERALARVLDADRAEWVATHARPALSPCLCGCGSETKGRFFPGHDATLKSALAATAEHGDDEAKAQAEAALATFGW